MAYVGTIGCNFYARSLPGFRKMQGNCSRARPEVTKTGEAFFSRRPENCSSLLELTRKLYRDGVENYAQHNLPLGFKSSRFSQTVSDVTAASNALIILNYLENYCVANMYKLLIVLQTSGPCMPIPRKLR